MRAAIAPGADIMRAVIAFATVTIAATALTLAATTAVGPTPIGTMPAAIIGTTAAIGITAIVGTITITTGHEIRRSVSHWNGRWWGGRWYAYGVGPCWSLQPGGLFIWVCVP